MFKNTCEIDMYFLYLFNNQLYIELKHYNENQLVLFSHTFEGLISREYPVRIVNDVLEKVNISKL